MSAQGAVALTAGSSIIVGSRGADSAVTVNPSVEKCEMPKEC